MFSGTASDNVGVTAVTWSTNTGGSGTAAGTTQWTATVTLLVGSNTVTIRATDSARETSPGEAWWSAGTRRAKGRGASAGGSGGVKTMTQYGSGALSAI